MRSKVAFCDRGALLQYASMEKTGWFVRVCTLNPLRGQLLENEPFYLQGPTHCCSIGADNVTTGGVEG
jgi:hypothetical protein